MQAGTVDGTVCIAHRMLPFIHHLGRTEEGSDCQISVRMGRKRMMNGVD